MLNPFPQLLAFGLFAPFVLRVFLGLFFVAHGWIILGGWCPIRKVFVEVMPYEPSKRWVKALGIVEIITGVLVIIGLWTQMAVLVLALTALAEIVSRIKKKEPRFLWAYILMFVISLSLMLSGAGFWAFDLPL